MELPQDMKYFLQRMAFNRVPTRVSPLSSTSASLSDTISVRLPTNCLLDISTLAMFFKMRLDTTETSKFAGFGRGSHSPIRSIQLTVGGNTILHLNDYGKVYSALHLLTCSEDANTSKSVLTYNQNINTTLPATANFGGGSSGAGQQMAVLEFYGLSGMQPSIIDTSLLNSVEMHIQLHSDYQLAGGLATATPGSLGSYSMELTNIHFYVDVIQTDDMYRQILRESMNSGVNLEISIPNYFIFTNSSSSGAHSAIFSVGSQSLDALVLVPTSTAASLGVAITNDGSGYIAQNAAQFRGTDIDTVSIEVNGQKVLSDVQQSEVFYHQFKSFGTQSGGVAASLVGSVTRDNSTADGLSSGDYAGVIGSCFLPSVRFSHGVSDGRLISGLNAKSSGGVQVNVTTTDKGNATPPNQSLVCVALCTSTLTVGAGGQMAFTS